jgi:hypothetical protein
MDSKKLKHKKIKNTGLLYEFLIRQVTSDVLKGQTPSSIDLIKKYFKQDSPLREELELYNVILNQKVKDTNVALQIIETVLQARKKIDNSKLLKDKYNLLKEIKNRYNVDLFLKTKINNYPLYASIYSVLENCNSAVTQEYIKHKVRLAEHLTTTLKDVDSKTQSVMDNVEPDLKNLAFKIMTEKFNQKWGILNPSQKEVLKQFIHNTIDSKESFDFIKNQVQIIESKLKHKITTVEDQVLKIKLSEVLGVLPKIENSSFITENHYLSLIRYYELLDELN